MATASLRPDDDSIPMIAPRAPSEGPLGDVGPYELLKELAQGGMGRVYLARERGEGGFTRLVALKKIHEHLSREKSFVDMFLDEARIASGIQHPHVCSVFDFGRADDAYFIAMEYLKGLPLSEVLRELGTNPPEHTPERFRYGAYLLAQACEGLHAAHELRDADGKLLEVVHRDVSPHNLFVTYDGTLRVLDFGIARAADRLAESTTGRVKGKFAYMAPEQALGKPVDRRADVFSLGVILWEMLTLQRLFRRDSPAETVLLVVSEDVPSPSLVAPQIPSQLERIAMRALSRDPEKRFQSCREMARALTRASAELGPPASPGDVEDWMGTLFPGASEHEQQLLTSYSNELLGPGEITGQRAKLTPSSQLSERSRRRRAGRGVPIVAALVIAVVTAAVAFGIARMTGPTRMLATLPSDAPPSGQVQEAPLAPADLTFEAPVDEPAPDPAEAAPEEELGPEEVRPDQAEPDEPQTGEPQTGEPRTDEPTDEPQTDADPSEEAQPSARGRRRGRGARRRRQGAPAASAGHGRVRFSAPTGPLWGARIFHRGRPVGTVPGIVRLPAGQQTVVVVGGGRRITQRVDVRPNQDVRVVVR